MGDNVQDIDEFRVEYSMQHCVIHCCVKQWPETLVSTQDSVNRLILINIGSEDVVLSVVMDRESCIWPSVAVAVLCLISLS